MEQPDQHMQEREAEKAADLENVADALAAFRRRRRGLDQWERVHHAPGARRGIIGLLRRRGSRGGARADAGDRAQPERETADGPIVRSSIWRSSSGRWTRYGEKNQPGGSPIVALSFGGASGSEAVSMMTYVYYLADGIARFYINGDYIYPLTSNAKYHLS